MTPEPIDPFPFNYGVLGGILIGVVAAKLWEKYYRVKLPDWLAFFGGHRFIPIMTSVIAIIEDRKSVV